MPDSKHTTLTFLILILLLAVVLLVAPAGAEPVQTNGTSSIGVDQTQELKDSAALPAPRHIFINVANDAGVKYNLDGAALGGPDNTYYIKADNGGLNELHITSDVNAPYGQVTTSGAQSGTFYVSNTGGRGSDDDIILLVSVKGPIPDDFSFHVKSSGYTWTPSTVMNANPTEYHYVTGVDETFTKSDLIYGPQTWKPGSGDLPLYYGQDINDASTAQYLMFIDLKAGNMKPATFPNDTLINNGALKIDYSFTNLNTFAAFNGYAWCLSTTQGQGITWTNQPFTDAASGYTVTGIPRPTTTATTTVPTSAQTTAITTVPTSAQTTVPTTGPTAVYTTVPTTRATTIATTVSTSVPTTPPVTPTPTVQPLVTNFTANVTAGQSPLPVQFNDTTTGAVQSYFWQFGDGGASFDQNPVHTYTTAGTYTVSLVASGSNGAQVKTIERYINVTVPATPTPTVTMAGQIPNHYHNYLHVANDEGPRFDSYNNGTYYQGQDNGGLNAVWLTQNLSTVQGQKITTSNKSGTFYMMDTGGRGWEDDGLVMLAVNGTIPDDFKVHIRTSGYTWTPISKNLRPTIDQITYVDGALDETFTKDDLIYGPQLWRPAGAANYPIYDGQNMTDTNNTFRIMFIDLRAGVIGSNTTAGSPPLQNNGGIRVDYSFENLTTFAAFDIYGYCKDSNAGEGISWTNAVNTFSQISHGQASIGSGLCVIGVPSSTAPITIPSATHPPTDPNGDGLYEDLNGDGAADFNDVVLFFNQMDWIADNEPVTTFDFNKNGSIDFDDVVLLFNML